MKKYDVLKTCYSLFEKNTPLPFDCGKLCDGKCCKGDEKTGMLLFPGEENLIDPNIKVITNSDGLKTAVCNGVCDRRKRPLSCRIYPLFPLISNTDGEEKIKTVFDVRADCPIKENSVKPNGRFVKAVRRTGKYLLLNEDIAAYYRKLSEEIAEFFELEKIVKNF